VRVAGQSTKLASGVVVHKQCTAAATHGGFVTACAGGMCCSDVCIAVRNKHVDDMFGARGASTQAHIRL